MRDTIGITELRRMFAEAAKNIRQEHENLSRLDCIGGDGDHGTTMLRAFESLEESIDAEGEMSLNTRLKSAGWCVLGVDGGASSAILGTFIAGMGDADLGLESDCEHLAASFVSGLRAVSKQTKAQPGDKTMIDALQPAVQAFEAAAAAGWSISQAMQAATEAARQGADTTSGMIARFGRAKFLGEKTRGSSDAGATSIALIFRGFSRALPDEKEN
jgi:dihydroxyacetone kinase-like protein